MGGPKHVTALTYQEAVVRIVWTGFSKGWSLSESYEHNNSESYDVYLRSFVGLIHMNFWSHVALRSKLSVKLATAIAASDWGSKSEISDFKVVVVIKHKVFGL